MWRRRAGDVNHAHLFVRQRNAMPNLRQTRVENHLSTQRRSFDERRTGASTSLVSAVHFPQDLATVQERDVGVISPITNGDLKWSATSAVASVVTCAFGSFNPSYRPGVATMRHGAHAMTNMTSESESQNRYSHLRTPVDVSTPGGNRHVAKARSSAFHSMTPPVRSRSRSPTRLKRTITQNNSTPTAMVDETSTVGKASSAAQRAARLTLLSRRSRGVQAARGRRPSRASRR